MTAVRQIARYGASSGSSDETGVKSETALIAHYNARPRKTDHWAKTKIAPTNHGTPKMAQRFAWVGGVLRKAAACETP